LLIRKECAMTHEGMADSHTSDCFQFLYIDINIDLNPAESVVNTND